MNDEMRGADRREAEIIELQPDDELNAAIATEVMGWTRYHDATWLADDGRRIVARWSPATDIADAFEVVERMRENGVWVTFSASPPDGQWVVNLEGASMLGKAPIARIFADTLPRAICEAALKAVGHD